MENSTMIGNRITEARKKINLSQAQLAERLFISPQAVGKWERGESMPDITTFSRLAEILGVDLNYFSEKFSNHENLQTPDISLKARGGNTPLPAEKLNWDMSVGNWVDADFSGLKNLQDKFSSSNMRNCKFLDSDFAGLHFERQ